MFEDMGLSQFHEQGQHVVLCVNLHPRRATELCLFMYLHVRRFLILCSKVLDSGKPHLASQDSCIIKYMASQRKEGGRMGEKEMRKHW